MISKNKSSKSRRRYSRKSRRSSTKKVSKSLRTAIKQVVKTQFETKTINVPDPTTSGSSSSNTLNRVYGQGVGLLFLAEDIFKVAIGANNNTVLPSVNNVGNRIGDRVRGVGFLLDYFFHTRSSFTLGSAKYHLPFVKLRISVYTCPFGVPKPDVFTLYDPNMIQLGGASLRPIDWDEGVIKNKIYDKLIIIRNQPADPLGSDPNTIFPYDSVYHFRKYFKYDKIIKYMDSTVLNPNGTHEPIYVSITAEVDDSFSGLVPSNTTLLYITGRSQAWFKDA